MANLGEPLSDRELAVLESLVSGATNREIARDLDISHNTVKVHLRNIFAKLGVSSRTEAVKVALQQGLLTVPGLEVEMAAESSEVAPTEAQPDEPEYVAQGQDKPRQLLSWRHMTFLLVALLAVVITGLIVQNLVTRAQNDGTPGAELASGGAVETPIGDTGWLQSTALPRARANMALITIGLDLYVVGGEVEAGIVNLVDVFESDTGMWRAASAKPTAVTDVSAAVLFGELYVPGGRLTDGRPTSVVEVYSPANNAWRPVAPLPTPLAGGLALSDGNLLYYFGGWDGEQFLAGAFSYNPAGESWNELSPMEEARANSTGAFLDNKLYVLGGENSEQELSTCEYFDVGEGKWFSCSPLQVARAGAGSAVLGNKLIYVIGGGTKSEVGFGEVFDATAQEWRKVEIPVIAESASWYGLGVSNVETRIYALGGRMGEVLQDGNYIFAPFIHQTFLPAVGGEE